MAVDSDFNYIFNDGSSAHRGVWHIVKGDVIKETLPAKTHEYESTWLNCLIRSNYPECEVVSADIMCNSVPRYSWSSGKQLKQGGYGWGSTGVHRKRHAEHVTHDVTVRPKTVLYHEAPEMAPGPLCGNCRRMVGL